MIAQSFGALSSSRTPQPEKWSPLVRLQGSNRVKDRLLAAQSRSLKSGYGSAS